jgi:3-deoxy-D-manno-octulosonic acid kinase
VQAPFGRALLRHYRRGGLVARLFHDRYLWSGTENTRAFREFRLLAKATDRGLPVPAPLAARIERTAGWYRADILLDAIDGAVTLAARAARERAQVPWAAIGQAIGAIHRAGIWHADLNAHNVLIGPEEKVWIVDFDRASERPLDASWCAGNLERLHRSLTKLGIVYARADFNRDEWPALVLAHAQMLPAVVPGERDVALKSASS